MNEKYRETLGSLLYEIIAMQALLDKELSQDWKTYTITINDETHELNPECEPAIRSMVINTLLKDAISSYIDDVLIQESSFKVITQIFEGSRKEDHQFEIVKEAIMTNLDADGNPITAKPLNEDSVYVQWQDQNKVKFETSEEEHEKFIEKLRQQRPDCEYLKKNDAHVPIDDKTKQINEKIRKRGEQALKIFDEYIKKRSTPEEIAQIEKEAQTEVLELREQDEKNASKTIE